MAKSATIFSLVGEICLDGRPVLPSLLVKLKYVNDLLAEREREKVLWARAGAGYIHL